MSSVPSLQYLRLGVRHGTARQRVHVPITSPNACITDDRNQVMPMTGIRKQETIDNQGHKHPVSCGEGSFCPNPKSPVGQGRT